MKTRQLTILQGLMALMAVAALSCSSSPTAPATISGGGGGTTGPPVGDAPALPVPANPTADVPQRSDVHVKIAPLTTHFRPHVEDLRASWQLRARECLFVFGNPVQCLPWTSTVAAKTWSKSLPAMKLTQVTVPMAITPGRLLLVKDGDFVVGSKSWSGDHGTSSWGWEREQTAPVFGLSDSVYLKRERVWERKTLLGGAGEYLLLIGNTEGSLATTVTKGTSKTETQEFGSTLSVSAGLSFGPLSAGVEKTFSETFSTSVEISESKSETFTKTVHGTAGKTVRFMVWELIETYSFCDRDGNPFTDPNMQLKLESLERRGVATALQATEF